MKHVPLLPLLFMTGLFCLTTGCRQSNTSESLAPDSCIESPNIPKATAIAWVDFNKHRAYTSVRTVKAHVNVSRQGKITVLEFVKKQPRELKKYLHAKLQTYRVPKALLEEGYIKPENQYMQLRYVPEWMKQPETPRNDVSRQKKSIFF